VLATPAPAGEPAPHDGAGPTVLMVDDDADVRTSVSRGLRHSGFDIRVAASGKEALRLLASESRRCTAAMSSSRTDPSVGCEQLLRYRHCQSR